MKIISAFRFRHPACAALIGLVFGPDIVMAYLGRGWLAIIYLALAVLLAAAELLLLGTFEKAPAYYGLGVVVVLRIIGAVHGYLAARTQQGRQVFPWYSHWYSLPLVFIALSFALAMLFRSLLFQPFTIPAGSMMPTLQVGDYMFVEKYAYGYARYSFPFGLGPQTRVFAKVPERGDVIVFRTAKDPNTDYVKRLVGLPGDRIQIRSGITYLNGQPLPRQPEGSFGYQGNAIPLFREMLPSGRFYTVAEMSDKSRGDNTAEWLVPAGHYFFLGDNRDNSLDSRFDMGFVPDENIVGKASLILFNANDSSRKWLWVR